MLLRPQLNIWELKSIGTGELLYISRVSWSTKVHYCAHHGLLFVPILSQNNPFYAIQSKISFNVILSSMTRLKMKCNWQQCSINHKYTNITITSGTHVLPFCLYGFLLSYYTSSSSFTGFHNPLWVLVCLTLWGFSRSHTVTHHSR